MPGPRMTTDDYFRTPETVLPQELVYGVLRDAAAPTLGHQFVLGQFFMAIALHLRDHGAGAVWLSPIDVVLDPVDHLIVQPDLVTVSTERLHIVTDRVRGAPDLVLEVLSPHPRIGRLDERLSWFARHGVRECWLVHQSVREVEVIQFAHREFESRQFFLEDETIRSTVLPDFHQSFATILR